MKQLDFRKIPIFFMEGPKFTLGVIYIDPRSNLGPFWQVTNADELLWSRVARSSKTLYKVKEAVLHQ